MFMKTVKNKNNEYFMLEVNVLYRQQRQNSSNYKRLF